MRIRGFMKVAMVLALIAVSLFALGGAALASTGLDGPNNPPVVSDPVNGNVTPHGGFSSSTNFCLQCHSVHTAPGGGTEGYALLAEPSVNDVCATCHGLFGNAATGANPNTVPGNTGTLGTASSRTAFDVTGAAKNAAHDQGETDIPDETLQLYMGGWNYGGFNPARWDGTKVEANGGSSSYTGGGLYCGSCHTPHGDFGQAVNSKFFRSDAGGAVNERQRVYVRGMVTGDTFTLTFAGQTTAPIAYNATGATFDANILSALEGLSNIAPGDVAVASARVTFIGTYAATNVPTMTAATGTCAGACEAYAGTELDGGPGGTLDASYAWAENALIYAAPNSGTDPGGTTGAATAVFYLHKVAATGVWQKCTLPDGGGTCYNLVHDDAEGQLSYLYGYKILQAYPNHNFDKVESWGVAYRGRDAARWCGTCHPSKVSADFGAAFTEHNHPTDCTYCHGNPADGASADYPHTSTTGKFLKSYPDGLCINCHGSGSLL